MPRKIFYKPTEISHVHGNGEVVVDSPVDFGTSDGSHNCPALALANEQRKLEGESSVSMFQDCDNQSWNLRVGIEFVEMKFCGFCGSELKC